MSIKVTDFQSIKLKLASPEEIVSWSHGEVTKAETINYRTQRAEKDGLFCQKIFGPEKDWECYCGKYKRIRYKGVVCDKCGVEVTKSSVRRERMGHIELASPVAHIWFLRGVPSKIGTLLDIPLSQLEKVVYFASYIITKVDEEAKARILDEVEREFKGKLKVLQSKKEEKKVSDSNKDMERLGDAKIQTVDQIKNIKKFKVLSEIAYHDLSVKYGEMFEAGVGAEPLKRLIEELDLKKLKKEIVKDIEKATPINQKKLLKRLKIINGFLRNDIKPEWMFVTMLPVIPPELRPMVPLDGGRYASSDLNDLYRRVINRNNRLKKLKELNAPEVISRNEKRMLQEAVDALIDNTARKGTAVMASTGQKRQLRSLANMLKGKRGRFRQNLLGKRVDYSGRSVIVVGPDLRLDQCGLPKEMALELFKPFVIHKLIEREYVHNVKQAGRIIEEAASEVWAILEEVIQGKCVLLNRAPTLHRLGIQAFKPILIEGMAIQVHPLVCSAFNADFDGDQMAVHLPLGEEAQKEAREIMLSSHNLLKPSTGQPIVNPTQDIVLGCYFLTKAVKGVKGEGKIYSSKNEAVTAYECEVIDLHAMVKILVKPQKRENKEDKYLTTTPGRIIFSRALPDGYGFVNKELTKKTLEALTVDVIEKYGIDGAAPVLDIVKQLGFTYAALSGISWGMDDLKVPKEKEGMLKKADEEVDVIQEHYLQGLLTDEERYNKVVGVWLAVKAEISSIVPKSLDKSGSVYSIIASGARGSWSQPVQMSGMKGSVHNPSGEIIELPIKKSYKEGLGVLEYFISTHGARKGTADTALRTAEAGYLTRKLVDVSQDVIIRSKDCQDKIGIIVYRKDAEEVNQQFTAKLVGRVMVDDLVTPGHKKVLAKSGALINKELAAVIDKSGIEEVKVRSVLNCKADEGVCAKCYGYELGHNELVELGAAVGIVAAQAIGEPGTQLTMRTFHTGGVAGGGDITQGLPRVAEIFEVRIPKGEAVISEVQGKVIDIETEGKTKIVKIEADAASKLPKKKKRSAAKNKKKTDDNIFEYKIPPRTALWIETGDRVDIGQQLCEGHIDLKKLFKSAGVEIVQRYIIKEVQKIYIAQGEAINDRHVEIIMRQMLSRVRIQDSGDTSYSVEDIVDKQILRRVNKQLKKQGKKPGKAAQILYGITKVALSTESFLSAASFQETSRVLINAAIAAKEDHLRGLKENVIIGRLIPAGTGYKK